MSHTKALHDQSVLKLTSPSLTTDGYYVLQFQANVAEGGVWSVGWFFFPQIRCILPKEGDFKLQQKQRNHTYVCGVVGGWKETEYIQNILFKKQN